VVSLLPSFPPLGLPAGNPTLINFSVASSI